MSHSESTTGIIAGGVLSGGTRPEDWERRISQRSEQLYRARLLQRLLLVWAYPGNLALVALAVCCFAFFATMSWLWIPAAVVSVVSIGVSARLMYRQHFRVRALDSELREFQRARREDELVELGADVLAAHKRYRARVPEVIDGYRVESRKHRRRYNLLQSVIITGSILTSTLTTASLAIAGLRWLAVVVSLVVAVSAAYGGYAKYRERGVSLQQAADSLEREYESVELRVGRYQRFDDERAAYAEFAHEVEALRGEQAKRQQQLGHAVGIGVSTQ